MTLPNQLRGEWMDWCVAPVGPDERVLTLSTFNCVLRILLVAWQLEKGQFRPEVVLV
jgi:hypothetical protein